MIDERLETVKRLKSLYDAGVVSMDLLHSIVVRKGIGITLFVTKEEYEEITGEEFREKR